MHTLADACRIHPLLHDRTLRLKQRHRPCRTLQSLRTLATHPPSSLQARGQMGRQSRGSPQKEATRYPNLTPWHACSYPLFCHHHHLPDHSPVLWLVAHSLSYVISTHVTILTLLCVPMSLLHMHEAVPALKGSVTKSSQCSLIRGLPIPCVNSQPCRLCGWLAHAGDVARGHGGSFEAGDGV